MRSAPTIRPPWRRRALHRQRRWSAPPSGGRRSRWATSHRRGVRRRRTGWCREAGTHGAAVQLRWHDHEARAQIAQVLGAFGTERLVRHPHRSYGRRGRNGRGQHFLTRVHESGVGVGSVRRPPPTTRRAGREAARRVRRRRATGRDAPPLCRSLPPRPERRRHFECHGCIECGREVDGVVQGPLRGRTLGRGRSRRRRRGHGDDGQVDRWWCVAGPRRQSLHDGAGRGDDVVVAGVAHEQLHPEWIEAGAFELQSLLDAVGDVGLDLEGELDGSVSGDRRRDRGGR